jgi:serine/threonine protein kinase
LQSTYEQNLRAYLKSAEDRIPDISLLAVQRRGTETPAVIGALAKSITSPPEKYHRRWKIGGGTTGTLYNAVDRLSGFEVAIKEFHDKTKASEIALEIDILRSVIHVRS